MVNVCVDCSVHTAVSLVLCKVFQIKLHINAHFDLVNFPFVLVILVMDKQYCVCNQLKLVLVCYSLVENGKVWVRLRKSPTLVFASLIVE